MNYLKFIVPLCLVFCFLVINVSATPYESYTYDSQTGSTYSPNMYEPEQILTGEDFGCGILKNPEDMFVDGEGNIYILDSGNKRIVITDKNFHLIKVIKDFYKDKKVSPLNEPKGMFVNKNKNIYIADTGNNRVICVDYDGVIKTEIVKPKSESFPQTLDFIPTKIVADGMNNLYVVATGVYQGAVVFDEFGVFQGFFASNTVVATGSVITDFFWKQIMTKEQKNAMSRYVPPELRNMAISNDGFIYTITNSAYLPWTNSKEDMDVIKKLNPKDKNIIRNKMSKSAFEALKTDAKQLNFVDATVDSNGFLNVADDNACRILQFDVDMNLMTVFGTKGDCKGAFDSISAIECFQDKIYVLDREKNNFTIFGLTDFGQKVHNAVKLYNAGLYDKAIGPWKDILNINNNYELAYVGIGSALMNEGKFKEAMHYFELGYDSEKYNAAFSEYRTQFLRKNFVTILLTVIVLVALAIWLLKLKKRKRNK